MLTVRIENGAAVEALTWEQYEAARARHSTLTYENRNDWKTMERAEQVSNDLTRNYLMKYLGSQGAGRVFLAVDNGPNVSPRYDVIEAPKVGDKVSRAFNGDFYPEGIIVKVSASYRRVETSTGVVFFRRRQSAVWSDGTFSMVQGHISRLNPSF
jgi:hypothetical protein